MDPRRLLVALIAPALLLGAAATALAEPPSVPASDSPGGDGTEEARPGNHSGNHTLPPRDDTRPPPTNSSLNRTLSAPVLSPDEQNLTGRAGIPLPFEITVTNPASETQRVVVTVDAPLGWKASVGAYDPVFGPGESRVVKGTLEAPPVVRSEGTARLWAQGESGGDGALLHACFAPANPLLGACPDHGGGNRTPPGSHWPPRNHTRPPGNDTRGPGNETSDPANEPREPGNGTWTPRNGTTPSGAAPERGIPADAPLMVLRADAGIDAGGAVTAGAAAEDRLGQGTVRLV